MPINSIELFSGAGLMGGAFSEFGFTPIFAADNDAKSVASYNNNIADVAKVWDVNRVRNDLRCELIIAGPPCQGFSSLGSRDKHDFRNKLSYLVGKWAINTNASIIVIENVPQFINSVHWDRLRDEMEQHGFEATTWTLDAYDYGTPQRRLRSFSILSKIGIPSKPRKSRKRVTVRDAFSGLSLRPSQKGMDFAPIPSDIALQRFKIIPPGGDKRYIMEIAPELCPDSWFEIPGQATDVWGRMHFDEPSNTIRCSFLNASKGRYIHPTENRVISLREGARLQGVPDEWRFYGESYPIARQIGNGVPLPLGRAVAKSIKLLFS